MTPGESTPDVVRSSQPETSPPKFVWQPLTPRGVAAFAGTTFGRLLLVQSIVALLAAAAVVWFLATACFPTVRQAIRQLPGQGTIRNGQLALPQLPVEPLAEGPIVAIVVDLRNKSRASLSSDIRVEFRRNHLEVCSLFGCIICQYPEDYVVQFNRPELEPWWGAWEPIILGLVFIAVMASLLLSWAILATLYFGFVRLIAFFKDRDLTWSGSWRLASAALMPGAVWLTAGIVFYGLGALDVIRFLFVAVLHLVIGWIYLAVGILRLPRISGVARPATNPFAVPPAET
jgi:hypothetical protein